MTTLNDEWFLRLTKIFGFTISYTETQNTTRGHPLGCRKWINLDHKYFFSTWYVFIHG